MLNPVPFPVIIPVTFNDDKCVDAPWNIVKPETFNELLIVVILFNNVFPETFNVDKCVDAPWNIVIPETYNDDINVDGLLKFGIDGGFVIAL